MFIHTPFITSSVSLDNISSNSFSFVNVFQLPKHSHDSYTIFFSKFNCSDEVCARKTVMLRDSIGHLFWSIECNCKRRLKSTNSHLIRKTRYLLFQHYFFLFWSKSSSRSLASGWKSRRFTFFMNIPFNVRSYFGFTVFFPSIRILMVFLAHLHVAVRYKIPQVKIDFLFVRLFRVRCKNAISSWISVRRGIYAIVVRSRSLEFGSKWLAGKSVERNK